MDFVHQPYEQSDSRMGQHTSRGTLKSEHLQKKGLGFKGLGFRGLGFRV